MGRIFKKTIYSDYLGEERPLLDIDVKFIPETPTPTPSSTQYLTPSVTPTNTVTPTYTPTNTVTPTYTPTNTSTPTPTLTPTPSPVIITPPFEIEISGASSSLNGTYRSIQAPGEIFSSGSSNTLICSGDNSLWKKYDPILSTQEYLNGAQDSQFKLMIFSNTFTLCGSILSLIHISEPTRLGMTSYAVFCLKKKKTKSLMIASTSPPVPAL